MLQTHLYRLETLSPLFLALPSAENWIAASISLAIAESRRWEILLTTKLNAPSFQRRSTSGSRYSPDRFVAGYCKRSPPWLGLVSRLGNVHLIITVAERDTSKLGYYKLDFWLPTFTNATLAVSRNRTFDFHKCDCGLAVSRNRTFNFHKCDFRRFSKPDFRLSQMRLWPFLETGLSTFANATVDLPFLETGLSTFTNATLRLAVSWNRTFDFRRTIQSVRQYYLPFFMNGFVSIYALFTINIHCVILYEEDRQL